MKSYIDEEPIFDDVLKEHYNEIFVFILKQIENVEDSKDLTQEVFFKTFQNYHKYDPKKAKVRTWLYKIANNHVINYWKSAYIRKKVNCEIDFARIADSEDTLETLIKAEDFTIILKLMIKSLSKRDVRIMNLYFFSELSSSEIAISMRMNKKTVSNIISLSIKKIKDDLRDQHE